MTAAAIHLAIVHVPVVGILIAALSQAWALRARSNDLQLFTYVLVLACGIASTIAFYSGPPAADLLNEHYGVSDKQQIEHHALIGRAAFIGGVVAAIVSINALLRRAQGGREPRWVPIVLLALVLGLSGLFAWSAHEGGEIRHPELHGPPTTPG